MKCKAYKLTILMTLVLSIIWVQTGGAAVVAATNPTVKMSLNGEVLNLPGYGDGLALRQGTAYIQLYSLMVILDGNLKWDENTLTAIAQYMDKKIQFKINSDECVTDGQTIKLGYSTFAYHNCLMVPLRSVCEIFGIKLDWNALNQTVNLDIPGLINSERLYNAAIPAQIAFINHGHLYIMDGNQPGSTPVLINRKGENEIIGWSADGQWLAYLNSPVRYNSSGEQYLWVVKADGSQTTEIDSHPVFNNLTSSIPKWSPINSSLAFVARESANSYDCISGINISSYQDGKWILRNIPASNKSDSVSDLAWAPDGQSLAISVPGQNNKGMRIERLRLSGQSSILLEDNKAMQQEEPNYLGIYSASGMKWSPDGRYLAYYLCPQSASMTCDGTNLQILDTHSTGHRIDLGCGLAYSDWLAWSHDSTKLAYIKGAGREAFTNKKLVIADLGQNKPKFTECTPSGQVDVQPMWVPDSNTLLFCRGADNEKFDYTSGEFMVPGQSIWQRSANGEMKAVSSGSPESADYAPTISDDSQNLIYLHLNEENKGSLYLRNITADKIGSSEHKIVDLCGVSVGFYGNYLPRWFSVYWTIFK